MAISSLPDLTSITIIVTMITEVINIATEVKGKPPRTIQLQYPVYERLEIFRGKRETFSQAVDRLLTMVERVGALQNMVARAIGSGQLPESQVKDARELTEIITGEQKEVAHD